jgi:hypothetical protein
MAKGGPCPLKAPQYQTGLFQGGEIKPRRAAYADGRTGRLTERRLISVTRFARLAVLLVHGSAHCHARLAGSRSVGPVIIRQQRARAGGTGEPNSAMWVPAAYRFSGYPALGWYEGGEVPPS